MPKLTIMRPGCYAAMSGERICFDAATLAQIASVYNPALRDAPLVIGHPANDASSPAHGWITSLSTGSDGELIADLSSLSEEIKTLVRAGKYRNISASFMPPHHPANPRPGGWYLRHVGALGASGPAVPGLSKLAFAESCPLACPIDLAAKAQPDWKSWNRFMDSIKIEEDAARAKRYAQLAPTSRKAQMPKDPHDDAAWERFYAEVDRELIAAQGERLLPPTR